MKNKKSQWGGLRNPPGGRPPNKLPTKLVRMQVTDEEYQLILSIDSRKRTELLVKCLKEGKK